MLGASYGLVNEGVQLNIAVLLFGLLCGLILIVALNARLEGDKGKSIEAFRGAGGMKALLIVGVMTLHSFAEGIGVGVAYGGGQTLGTFITLAIAIHNIPEGLAISLVMVPRGSTPSKAALWSIFSSLPQPLMAIPAFLLVSTFKPFLPFGLGLAAGAMIWMAFAELIADALRELPRSAVALIVALGLAGMVMLQTLL